MNQKEMEIIVKRLMRRSRKTASAVFTPFPVSSFGPLNYMFPARGVIRKLVSDVDEMPKDGVDIVLEITTEDNVFINRISTKKRLVSDLNYDVLVGDRVKITIIPTNSEQEVGDYWISLLWIPHKSEVDVMKFMISELDKLEESYASEDQEG